MGEIKISKKKLKPFLVIVVPLVFSWALSTNFSQIHIFGGPILASIGAYDIH